MDVDKILALLVFLLTSGCDSFSEVNKEDLDLENSYDGDWIANHETTHEYQRYGNWRFTCNQLTTPITVRIEGSVIQVQVNNEYLAPLEEAYISSSGSFKTALPTGIKGETSRHSEIYHSDVEVRLIVEGNLTPDGHGKGNIIIGWAASGYRGCKTKSAFSKE